MRRHVTIVCIAVMAICGLARRATCADAGRSSYVEVCRDSGRGEAYQVFPDVCRLQDGRLMVVFYSSYAHVGLPSDEWPSGGRICFCTSSDEGRSWSKAEVLYDGPDDDRDPSIVQLKDGRLLCSFFKLRKGPSAEQPYVGLGVWLVVSEDAGKTWSEPQRIYDETWYCSSPIRELSDGRLVLGLYRSRPDAGAVGISDDGGKTWNKAIDIDNGGRPLTAETDLIELKDGSLYAAERSEKDAMGYAISKDRGQSWSVSKPIGFGGQCPYLHRTADGIILLGYRLRMENFGESTTQLRFSLDECQTWSDAILVDEVPGAYPSMVNLKDGSVLIVYYDERWGPGSTIRAKRLRVGKAGVEWLAASPFDDAAVAVNDVR
jgi:hypothetical protein